MKDGKTDLNELKEQGNANHLWHVWINSLKPDGPAGCPHKKFMYSFKSAIESLGYFEAYLRDAFTGKLRQLHQQSLHGAPEKIPEKNVVRCALGKTVTECPILLSLKESIEKGRGNAYYQERVSENAVYGLMAKTCAWHMLMSEVQDGTLIDWNEGALSDTSDRMFWNRVYTSLASGEGKE